MDGVADQLGDGAAARGVREEFGDRAGVAVVQWAHAVEQVRDRRTGASLGLRLREMLTRVCQSLARLYRVGIRVAPGRYRSPIDKGLGNRSGTVGIGLLRGQRHRQRVALAIVNKRASQVRVGINDVGRVLRTAALMRNERPLKVDAGELVSLGQLSQGLRARSQHLSGSGHAGRNERGRPMTTMLEDCHEGRLSGLRVGEGLSTATVAVNIDEAGKVG